MAGAGVRRFGLCGQLALFFLSVAATGAWGAEAQAPSPEDTAFFEQKIRPLLIQRCFECHADGPKGAKGGLRLDSAIGVTTGGDSGPVIVAGKPDESLLVEAILYKQEGVQMPPRGKLPAGEIELLTEWVRRGAPYPPSTDEGEKVRRPTGIDFGEGRKFWSFQPLATHPAPATTEPTWCRSTIDPFILKRLEQQGLKPSPPADRRTLLRRLSFDLIGLPPTAEELAEFQDDTSPNAVERQVDRLLASPHYGERWGRFWLDLVRYCDVPEAWAIEKSAQAWLYRDWVIRAFNDDIPYDRFLQLQLAADLTPEAQPADIAALGLLGLSPNYWKELKLDPAVIKSVVAEEWEERVHTLSGSILGLTVACARCHDHKLDPISQEDYYALVGVLASTRITTRSILPESQAKLAAETRARIETMKKSKDELLAQKPAPSDEAKQQAEELSKQIVELEKSGPYLDVPLAYAADEASLHILPDGPDRTRLDYHPGEPQNVALQIRGSPTGLGPAVPRRFLTVLSPAAPTPFQEGSGRRELARALVTEAGPLTARVIVNRIWQQHFGQGLVDSPSNFGTTGSRPTHPELFDDLASRFVVNGWSFKWLHRELVLSAAYQQSSTYRADGDAVDPDNRLLWRANRRRLEVEAWRDAMLAATGRLDLSIGGSDRSLDDPGNFRRTVYATVKRRDLHAMQRLMDFPDPTTHIPARDVTTTPLQQLFVLNSPFMLDQATALANQCQATAPGNLQGQVRHAYQLLFGRDPTERQRQLAETFFADSASDPTRFAEQWKQYAQALLSGNELAFVD